MYVYVCVCVERGEKKAAAMPKALPLRPIRGRAEKKSRKAQAREW